MAKIDLNTTLSLKQVANLIINTGAQNRYLLRGEPGIGKSAIMKYLKEHFGDRYEYAYLDCSTLDLGDIGYPAMDHENGVAKFYPNVRFGIHTGKPVIIMLDEFGKAMAPVQNMLHPLLEVNNPRLGDRSLPPGSIVFLTTNLSSDGVGDNIKAHTLNRVSEVKVRKPNDDEWLEWGMNNGVDPVVLAFVKQFPQVLESYTTGVKDNPYIFNPSKPDKSYISPRSLELGSHIVKQRRHLDIESTIAALAGTIGEAGARDMQAFITYQDQLPGWKDIIEHPTKAKVPDSPGASAVLIFGAVTKIDDKTMEPFTKYLERFPLEWQAVFFVNAMKNKSKQEVLLRNKAFQTWMAANQDVI